MFNTRHDFQLVDTLSCFPPITISKVKSIFIIQRRQEILRRKVVNSRLIPLLLSQKKRSAENETQPATQEEGKQLTTKILNFL